MPVDVSPLFRPEVLRPLLAAFPLPERAEQSRERLRAWASLLDGAAGKKYNEQELLPDFISDVFLGTLGYSAPVAQKKAGHFSLSREKLIEVDGKFADAVVGNLGGDEPRFAAVVEGKGPLDPLERPYAGRKRSAVEQAYNYAINLPCDWIIVTNMREIRLYYKGSNQRTYERFTVAEFANDEKELRRLVFLLGAEQMVPPSGRSHLYALLEASGKAGEQVTQEYYSEYAELRRQILSSLLAANPNPPPSSVLPATQRVLDRTLFVAFAVRGLQVTLAPMTARHRRLPRDQSV